MKKKSEKKGVSGDTLNKMFGMIASMQGTIATIQETMVTRQEFGDIRQRMMPRQEFEPMLNRILTKVVSIEDTMKNMVTHHEFREFRSNIYDHIDGFVKLHQTLDTEVASLRHAYDRLDGSR